jgi:hypothetical protein
MTISGYSNAIVDLMLGWLKGIANWVLRLFNLAGSASGSPLVWLADNWSKLLIFFLVLGLVLDRLIWLIRWRPYWVWFRKERVIVNDDRFFINADIDRADDLEGDLASNWDEHDYVVASTVVKRKEVRKPANQSSGAKRRPISKGNVPASRRRPEGTRVKRHVSDSERTKDEKHSPQNAINGAQGQEERVHRPENIFATRLKKRDVSDSYEDEVFNVSNLPAFDEFNRPEQAERKSRRKRR